MLICGGCGIGPCFRPVRRARKCADRSVSQLLAGTPSGPGGSSNAARVPRCDEARRRRTPSRLTTPHETPFNWTRCGHHKRGSGDGDYAGITHLLSSSRRKPGSRGNARTSERLWIPAFAGMTELVVCSEDANPSRPSWERASCRDLAAKLASAFGADPSPRSQWDRVLSHKGRAGSSRTAQANTTRVGIRCRRQALGGALAKRGPTLQKSR